MTTTFSQRSQTSAEMPTTHGWPLVGSLPDLLRSPLPYLLQAHATYGDIYRLNLGVTQFVVLNHPRHAQYVLVDHARNYRKGGALWDGLRTLMGNGLPVSEGAFWLRQRRMMQPHFHRQRLAVLTEQMVAEIERGLATWPANATLEHPFNIAQAVTQITMRVIVRALFGAALPVDDMDKAASALSFAIDHLGQGLLTHSFPAWLPLPGRRHYGQALQTVNEVVFAAIEGCRQGNDENLIGMLLDMVDGESGEQMTPQQLRDEAVTMFVAGYETTANTLAWTLHFLTQQPELQSQLQHEIATVLGDRLPTFADLPALSYTRMVLQEALRYYPPAWHIPRTAVADDEIDGYPIRSGEVVAVNHFAIHHDARFWPQPERFLPERFTAEQSAQRPKLAWMPFGAGQRFCIGNELATMEGQLVLAMIIQRFQLAAAPGKVAQPFLTLTLRPKTGVWVTVEAKNK